MATFSEYPINFLLAGLFLIAMISFGVGLASNYGESGTLMKSDKIDFTRLEQAVNKTSADATHWGESFKSDNLFVSAGGIILFSIWGIGKLIWGSVTTMFSVFSDGATAVLGIPPIATGVVLAILIISLIFALWRVIKAGE